MPATELLAANVQIAVNYIDGLAYYYAGAPSLPGEIWSTGPCPSPQSALDRLIAYHAGLVVSEAAPGLLSCEQMDHVVRYLINVISPSVYEIRGRKLVRTTFEQGVNSDSWVRASVWALTARISIP